MQSKLKILPPLSELKSLKVEESKLFKRCVRWGFITSLRMMRTIKEVSLLFFKAPKFYKKMAPHNREVVSELSSQNNINRCSHPPGPMI